MLARPTLTDPGKGQRRGLSPMEQDELVDLPVSLSVDDPSGLALCRPAGAPEPPRVAVLDSSTFPRSDEPVELETWSCSCGLVFLRFAVRQDDALDDRAKFVWISGRLHGRQIGVRHRDASHATVVELRSGATTATPHRPDPQRWTRLR